MKTYNAAKEKIPFLERILRKIPSVQEYTAAVDRLPDLEQLVGEDSAFIDDSLIYMERIEKRICYEIANTANQLAYSRVNLDKVLKMYLLDKTLAMSEAADAPGIVAKTCRIASILHDKDDEKKEGLLKKGLAIREKYGDWSYEDNIENAYFHLHLARLRFLRHDTFDTMHWYSFLGNLEKACVNMEAATDKNVPFAAKVLHYIFYEAYEFFQEMGSERKQILASFGDASIGRVDAIIHSYHRVLDKVLHPLDMRPKPF
jgi:hypothetical protein